MLCNDNLWKNQKEPTFYILEELNKHIDITRDYLNICIDKATDELTKKNYIDSLKNLLNLYNKTSSSGYLSVLIKCLRPLFTDDLFEEK